MTYNSKPPNSQQKEKKIALALGGGGARGSYEIGIWKALRELKIEPDIVTGISVGSLNGAAILQGDYELAEQMWKELEINHILEFELSEKPDNIQEYTRFLSRFLVTAIQEKGISSDPLLGIIRTYLNDETSIRNSGITFGLTVTDYATKEKEAYYLEDIPEGKLDLYLLASASFYPAMAPTMIEDEMYIDGGYRDTIPVSIALLKQPTHLIIADIDAYNPRKTFHIPRHIPYWHIASKWPLGDILFFDGNRAEINIQLGYLDALKSFGYYEGSWYTFDKEDFESHYAQFYQRIVRVFHTMELSSKEFLLQEENQLFLLKQLGIHWKGEIGKKEFTYAIQEMIGKMFHVNPTKIYTFDEFDRLLLTTYQKLSQVTSFGEVLDLLHDSDGHSFVKTIVEWSEGIKEKLPLVSNLKMCFYFLNLFERSPSTDFKDRKLQLFIRLRPLPFIMALYLYSLKQVHT